MNKGGKNETSADKIRTSASEETVAKNEKTVKKERVKAPKKPLKQRLGESKVSIAVLSAIIAAVTIALGYLNISFAVARAGASTPWYIYAYTVVSCLGILYFTARWAYKCLKK